MDQRYENDGQWVYMNGELYHAGIKGMKWGSHLPGTDWWKVGKNAYNQYMQKNTTTTQKPGYQYVDGKMVPYEPQTKKASKVKAFGSAVKAVSTYAGNQFKNSKVGRGVRNFKEQAELKAIKTYNRAKKGVSKYWNQTKGFTSEQASKLSEFAKSAYSEARKSVTNFFTVDSQERTTAFNNKHGKISSNTPLSHLDVFQNKQLDDAVNGYIDRKHKGSFGQKLDYWFQNAQYGIVKGVNQYLKNIGMDDEVDNFITKITGKKSASYNARKTNRGGAH